jgi:hypothetical protein
MKSFCLNMKQRFLLLLALAAQVTAGPTQGNNGGGWSSNRLRQITYFGERPAWSPDGKKVAFMAKSYGDAFEYDLGTDQVKLLTQYPSPGYLRVQYLPNGDLFLIGSRTFEDAATTREKTMEMWVLKPGALAAVALEHKIWEGVAISLRRNLISWANTHANEPSLEEGESVIYIGEIDYDDGRPILVNKTEVLRSKEPDCLLEPQDFRENDTEIVYSCYLVGNAPSVASEVRGVKIATGETIVYRSVPKEYNEVEGLYPDGRYALVESTHHAEKKDSTFSIDIWRLRLEPNSTDFIRLTYFSENPPNKAGNPVVSPNGRTMAVQASKAGDAPGVGYGILLLDLK